MKKFKNKIVLHPIMSFIILIIATIILSGILDLFEFSVSYNSLNSSGSYENTLVTVESLFNISGIKYIFSNTISNFASFTPLSMLLIVLIGIGIMDKSGFLDSFFYILTKKISKRTVTFSLSFICIIASIVGDISFITLIPLAALLFKYGKRNPRAGIICAFASLTCGFGLNILMSSTDSTVLGYTTNIAKLIISDYSINNYHSLFIMIIAAISLALVITSVTEKIIVPNLGSYELEEDEEDQLTKREKKGLIISGFFGILYITIFVYNIIPGLPFSGNLLDHTQNLYIDKLFGFNSFFNQGFVFVITFLFIILGLSYGIVNKTIKNHREMCSAFSHSLDGIGRVIVLIFMASMFIFIFKSTNIGNLVVASFANLINNSGFTGIPLILLLLFSSAISTFFMPSCISKWVILSGAAIPTFLNAGFSAEFTSIIFRAGESFTYGLTPVMAYFVIYIAFMELYSQDNYDSIFNDVKYIFIYAKHTVLLWIIILILFHITGLPIGIGTFPII